jgi:hypothetical protein
MRAKAGDRWSIVGMSQALRTDSGILVGPGMKTGFWKDMVALSLEDGGSLLARQTLHNFFEKIFH